MTSIGSYAFNSCTSITSATIPNSVTSIGERAFLHCTSLTSVIFVDTSDWYRTMNDYDWTSKTNGTVTDVTYANANATYFKSTYYYCCWYKL